MMSLAQKAIALGVILLMEVLLFVFSPLFGIIGLFATAPLAVAILKR